MQSKPSRQAEELQPPEEPHSGDCRRPGIGPATKAAGVHARRARSSFCLRCRGRPALHGAYLAACGDWISQALAISETMASGGARR